MTVTMRSKWYLGIIALTSLVGFALKMPCAVDSWSATENDLRMLCYSDIGPLYYLRGFVDGVIPYLQLGGENYLEYPVLTGVLLWVISSLTHVFGGGVGLFVALNWAVSAVLVVIAGVYFAKLAPNSKVQWEFALSPAILLALGINWDAAAVLALLIALYGWRNSNTVMAGLGIGLGAAAKLFPVLLIIAFALDALKTRNYKQLLHTTTIAAASWLVVNLPFMIGNFEGWFHFFSFSRNRGIDFGSPYLAMSYSGFNWISTTTANLVSAAALIATVIALYVRRSSMNVLQASFVIITVFAIFNKVYSPQYWLWLAPLVLLVIESPKLRWWWTVTQAIYFVAVWRFLLGNIQPGIDGSLDERTYAFTIVLMWITSASLVVLQFIKRDQPQLVHDQTHL